MLKLGEMLSALKNLSIANFKKDLLQNSNKKELITLDNILNTILVSLKKEKIILMSIWLQKLWKSKRLKNTLQELEK